MRGMKATGGGVEGGVVEADIIPGDGEVAMIDEVVLISILKEYLKGSPWQPQSDGGNMGRNTEMESRSASLAFGNANFMRF